MKDVFLLKGVSQRLAHAGKKQVENQPKWFNCDYCAMINQPQVNDGVTDLRLN